MNKYGYSHFDEYWLLYLSAIVIIGLMALGGYLDDCSEKAQREREAVFIAEHHCVYVNESMKDGETIQNYTCDGGASISVSSKSEAEKDMDGYHPVVVPVVVSR